MLVSVLSFAFLVVGSFSHLLLFNPRDLQDDFHRKQFKAAVEKETPLLLEGFSQSDLQKLLVEANFPTYPNEERPYFFFHTRKNAAGLKVFHTKEYLHFEKIEVLAGEKFPANKTVHPPQKENGVEY